MKKLFLTSMLVFGVIPAFAEPSHTQNTFPVDGLMQADYAYVGQANSDNMAGVYQNGDTVYANAQYAAINYSVLAGSYLTGVDNNNDATTDTCPSGNYCPGVASTTYENNAFGDNGLKTCPAEYASSDIGASAETDCYKPCTTANVSHSSAVIGNDYYGAGADTCEATACVNGYHVEQPDLNLTTLIGVSEAGTGSGYLSNDGEHSSNADTYEISHNGEFVVDYGNKGKIHGYAQCSTRSVTNPWYSHSNIFESDHFTETLPDSTGQYCYCRLDGYTPNGGTLQSLSTPWVFSNTFPLSQPGSCERNCADICAFDLRTTSDYLAFRAAVFGSLGASPATCEANTINIVWNHATQQDIDANNANVCVYDGDIRTPAAAETITGKTFSGWRFSTTQSQD